MRIGWLIVALLALPYTADATVIGASPGSLTFTNATRGGEYVEYLTISTSDARIHCTVQPTGETKSWISFDQNPFDVASGTQYRLPVRVTVPEMTPNGKYQGSIELRASPASEALGGTGMSVGAAIYIKTQVEVTGVEGESFRIMKVAAYNAKAGDPVKADIMAKNNARNAVTPVIMLSITDPDGKNEYSTASYDKETVDSLTKKTITATVPSRGIPPGIYLLDISVIAGGTEAWHSQEVFYIVAGEEERNPVLEGRMENAILSNENLTLGETLTITSRFKNTGEAPLNVKLKASIIKGGRTILTEESNATLINATSEADLKLDYRPPDAGDYSLQIWAEYSGQRTTVRVSNIKVWTISKPLLGLDQNFYIIIGPAAALIVLWLLFYYREYYQRQD